MRRIRLHDPETAKTLIFLTNHLALPAATICALYKSRWQAELFFKWIKQHLRIKRFFGTSENAVKTNQSLRAPYGRAGSVERTRPTTSSREGGRTG